MTHKCPIPGCTVEVPHHLLMCGRHWRRVPREIQRRVYAAWNRGKGDASVYLPARAAAIEAAQKEAA